MLTNRSMLPLLSMFVLDNVDLFGKLVNPITTR
jgi:hypothetical protein